MPQVQERSLNLLICSPVHYHYATAAPLYVLKIYTYPKTVTITPTSTPLDNKSPIKRPSSIFYGEAVLSLWCYNKAVILLSRYKPIPHFPRGCLCSIVIVGHDNIATNSSIHDTACYYLVNPLKTASGIFRQNTQCSPLFPEL